MLNILYDIIIQPIIYVIELAFQLMYMLTWNPGVSIIGVSVVVNLLCLPLYRMADEVQAAERATQARMARWVTHIKRAFSGDEQYMMLSTYYDEQGYRPARALLGSLPLLLQIPFFMAAYTYLSGLGILSGASFGPLANLGAPDGLIRVGGMAINLLPLLMTALNCASTAVYTRGLPLRDRVQAYGLAAVFLVLLYDSPSGLVFYWTCNQLFSLGKNVFMKVVPDASKWALILADACVLAGCVWLVASGHAPTFRFWMAILFVLAAFTAYNVRFFMKRRADGAPDAQTRPSAGTPPDPRPVTLEFFLGATLLSVLMGLLIPSSVIGASSTEFVNVYAFKDPLSFVWHATCVWLGFFVLWLGTYFLLSSPAARQKMAIAMWCLCGCALMGYFLFPPEFGTLSTELIFMNGVQWSFTQELINLAILLAASAALAFVWMRANRVVVPALVVLLAAIVGLSVPNITHTRSAVDELVASKASTVSRYFDEQGNIRPILTLSRTGKNVLVLFMDRAIGAMEPFAFSERPELAEKFDGFTFYPNTLSFGGHTNLAAPALYGGYEYTPTAINERADESLKDKHNEALLLLPTLFSEAGYQTTVVNPPYAGDYGWDANLSLYDSLKNTTAHDLHSVYTSKVTDELNIPFARELATNRSFVYYGLLLVSPRVLQFDIYSDGRYLQYESSGAMATFMGEWAVLHYLPQLTTTSDEVGDTFTIMCNETAHENQFLHMPDYLPGATTDSEDERRSMTLDDGRTMQLEFLQRRHYHVNMTSYLRLGEWFDWMREQGVYDNTRIIVVSDHGHDLEQFEELLIPNGRHPDDVEELNPLLMVKDFDAHGYSTSNEFMTNGDTPTLAMAGLIDSPVNPFTNKPINSDEKTAHDQLVTFSNHWDTVAFHGNTFDTSDRDWYAVHDDIFDLTNWQRID